MLHLLLTDDDIDDCFFFREALEEIFESPRLTMVRNGVQLTELLACKESPMPDVLFLDLNIPRKSGFECISEIKTIEGLKNLPIEIISTSFDLNTVNLLFENGAHHCRRKPGGFQPLKR